MDMSPTCITIEQLLGDRSPFTVPVFQRTYAWGSEEVMDFFHDITRLVEPRLRGDHRREQHFGNITSFDRPVAGTLAGRCHEVVDGQQRLATFSLFFAQVVHACKQIADAAGDDTATARLAREHAERVRNELLCYTDSKDGKPITRYRVHLSLVDGRFFIQLLDGETPEATRASHRRLREAQGLAREFIDTHLAVASSAADKLKRLRILEDAARKDCYIVHQVTRDKESARRLFELLNNRGVKLTQSDLLHSKTLGLLDDFPDLQEKAESAWITILRDERDKIEKQLRAVYSSHMGTRPGKETLLDEFMAFFQDLIPHGDRKRARKVLAIIEMIASENAMLRRLGDGQWPFDEAGKQAATVCEWDRRRLAILIQKKFLGHTLCQPLLLAATALGEDKFSAIVQLAERFFFRYSIVCGEHVTRLGDVYIKEALAIRANPKGYEVDQLAARLRELGARTTDAVFRAKLSKRIRYKPRNNNAYLQYFLATVEQITRWVEEGADGTPRCLEPGVIFELSQLQLEHIYPQNSKCKQPALEPHKHRLGNISFWSPNDNRRASNNEFVDKRHMYRDSSIRMNRRLAHLEQWGVAEIEAREQELLDLACKIFVI